MAKKWVIPDIHGYAGTLRALIEDKIRPDRHDTLFFLGDYIDRGPESKGVIDFIINLQESEYDVRALRGNHEDYLLRTYDNETVQKNLLGITFQNKLKNEWFKYGGRETLKSFMVSDVHEIPDRYIDWMRGLEYYFMLDDFILVHAGLNFGVAKPFEDKHSMLWIKEFKVDKKNAGFRKIVHGHVPISLDFINMLKSSNNYDYIDLDNGVYISGKEGFGNLVALELTTMELQVQHNVDRS
jgi:serine/threonine protein phosphatase 1